MAFSLQYKSNVQKIPPNTVAVVSTSCPCRLFSDTYWRFISKQITTNTRTLKDRIVPPQIAVVPLRPFRPRHRSATHRHVYLWLHKSNSPGSCRNSMQLSHSRRGTSACNRKFLGELPVPQFQLALTLKPFSTKLKEDGLKCFHSRF